MIARQRGAVAAVAAGGVLGALARYGAGLALPTAPGAFPLATFLVNVLGCLLMGATVALLARHAAAHPLWRPFLTTGVLGGFTTFSTYSVDADGLVAADRLAVGLLYLVGTLVAALAAAALGSWLVAR